MSWELELVIFFMLIPLLICGIVVLVWEFWKWNCRMADKRAVNIAAMKSSHESAGVYYYNDEF